jgi:outer membrane protein OmpA-like peptidoglycan-associated protein
MRAQEKGSYFTIGIGGGPSGLYYDLKGISSDGENKRKLGGNALIGYSYFFNRHWGLGTGIGVSYYDSRGLYKNDFTANDFFNLGNQVGDNIGNNNNYELRVRLAHWEEKQTFYTLDIPLIAQYQHKFGEQEKWGLYFSLGAKLHIPFRARYKVIDSDYPSNGRLNVSGLFEDSNIDYGSPVPPNFAIPFHAFGTIHNPNERLGWHDDLKLKLGISGIADFGFLFSLSQRIDLTTGAFIDYAFNNMKKESKPLLEAPEQYIPDAIDHIGNGIIYNGMVNSDRVDKAHLFSYGIKLGLRIKIGEIEKKAEKARIVEEIVPVPFPIPIVNCNFNTENLERVLQSLIDTLSHEPIAENDPNLEAMACLNPEETRVVLQKIYFDTNESFLYPESKNVLNEIAKVLKTHPYMNLKIFGNTDSVADDRINIPLGLRRAQSAKNYLVQQGIEAWRISVFTQSSYGPSVPNTTPENRNLNRSAEFVVVIQ